MDEFFKEFATTDNNIELDVIKWDQSFTILTHLCIWYWEEELPNYAELFKPLSRLLSGQEYLLFEEKVSNRMVTDGNTLGVILVAANGTHAMSSSSMHQAMQSIVNDHEDTPFDLVN